MPLDWEQLVGDSRDPQALGRWRADALDWVVTIDSHDEFEIRPKNRVHPDFRPRDQHAEVERLLAMGARRADVGQGEQPWVVLLDPEGNEFCILNARSS